jgi:hypothetical protein
MNGSRRATSNDTTDEAAGARRRRRRRYEVVQLLHAEGKLFLVGLSFYDRMASRTTRPRSPGNEASEVVLGAFSRRTSSSSFQRELDRRAAAEGKARRLLRDERPGRTRTCS